MIYFTEIRPTAHYLLKHAKDVRWEKVVEIILTTKNPRKKADRYKIEKGRYYILFEVRDSIMYVINAKKGNSK